MFTVYLNDPCLDEIFTLECESVKSVAENLEYYSRRYDLELDEYRTTDHHHLYFNAYIKWETVPEDLPF